MLKDISPPKSKTQYSTDTVSWHDTFIQDEDKYIRFGYPPNWSEPISLFTENSIMIDEETGNIVVDESGFVLID